jgi:prepilin-type processing-associated H-X9-DG protein
MGAGVGPDIMTCPSAHLDTIYHRWLSYTYNGKVHSGVENIYYARNRWTGYNEGSYKLEIMKLGAIKNPSDRNQMADGISETYNADYLTNLFTYQLTLLRHSGYANFLFCDGHVGKENNYITACRQAYIRDVNYDGSPR